jgi:hypothetical protein
MRARDQAIGGARRPLAWRNSPFVKTRRFVFVLSERVCHSRFERWCSSRLIPNAAQSSWRVREMRNTACPYLSQSRRPAQPRGCTRSHSVRRASCIAVGIEEKSAGCIGSAGSTVSTVSAVSAATDFLTALSGQTVLTLLTALSAQTGQTARTGLTGLHGKRKAAYSSAHRPQQRAAAAA